MKVYRGVEALVASGVLDEARDLKVRRSRQEDDDIWGPCMIVTGLIGTGAPSGDAPVLAGVALDTDAGETPDNVLERIEDTRSRRTP